jgi:anti-sigma factor RsiW
MNQDDESFLSAYIDGELDGDQQRRVESALDANAQLAQRMRALTQVRDLVAALPHDGSVDVTARVMQRIAARPRGRGLLPSLEGWRRGSRRILPLAGLAASAALLMVAASAAILMQTSQLENAGQTVAQVKHGQAFIASNPTAGAAPEEGVARSVVSSESVSSARRSEPAALAASGVAAASSVPVNTTRTNVGAENLEPWPSGDAARVRPLLESPNLKRFFWVGHGSRNDSEQVAASIIERTTHFDYFKITVAQGIVLDPRHPGEATVLAFVVDPAQLERFNDQLKAALPGLVEQEALDPGIATQLADIDRVQSFPPASLGEVEIPREALALRTRSSGGGEKVHGEQDALPAAKDSSGGGGRASPGTVDAARDAALESPSGPGPVRTTAISPAGADRGSLRGREPGASHSSEPASLGRSRLALEQKTVVLVWVSRPPAN